MLQAPNLWTYTIPDTVIEIADYAMISEHLEEVALGKKVKTIGRGAFAYSSIKEIFIPDSVEEIGEEAFMSCQDLEKVVLGNGVRTISSWTFDYCESLSDLTLSSGIQTIEQNAFSNTTALTHIQIPGHVKSIGKYAFDNVYCNVKFND